MLSIIAKIPGTKNIHSGSQFWRYLVQESDYYRDYNSSYNYKSSQMSSRYLHQQFKKNLTFFFLALFAVNPPGGGRG